MNCRAYLDGLQEKPELYQLTGDKIMSKKTKLETLKEMTAVQCSDGNWNYDPYMFGMANGMIFAISIFEDTEPHYLDAPEKWLKDLPERPLESIADPK